MSNCIVCDSLIEMSEFNHDYHKYINYLYLEVFKKFLYNNKVYFNDKKISLKRFPEECGWENSFFHLTTVSANKNVPLSEREPDFRRCERLHWIKPAIETDHINVCNFKCFEVFEDNSRRFKRIKMLNEEERYLIVLEDREDYYLLVTAFYIEHDYYLKGLIKEREKAKSAT
ncbi:hypothetical protein MWR47_05965 [Staphylococcus hominis]|uniref:hypothetical protein n=1 Tax=Staphylococcus hominis TaxID=1290 RepID=UPI0001EF533A|nr:hypothetical protein [Staphylococcus hominis]EFS20007.1 phage P1-related protein [Staphylococcus hominis subsp. hominis C80]MEB5575849.1 hypothetical protein [Staphylococcus hominis]